MTTPDPHRTGPAGCLVCGAQDTKRVTVARIDAAPAEACGHHPTALVRRALAGAARAGHRITA